jgi:hypothetical protein
MLFVFAVAAQSALIGANQDGIRLPAVVGLPSRLTEYSECNDIDQDFQFLHPTIDLATPALERLVQRASLHSLHQSPYSERDQVPLYELHAVWRI